MKALVFVKTGSENWLSVGVCPRGACTIKLEVSSLIEKDWDGTLLVVLVPDGNACELDTPIDVPKKGFGTLVYRLRTNGRLTQAELMEKLRGSGLGPGFSQSTISAWEKHRQRPDRERIHVVARALVRVFGISEVSEQEVIDSICD